jgi:hypothetical protein
LLVIIKRTAPTLSFLTIRDRYLTREEAHQVLAVLTEGQGEARDGVPAPPPTTTQESSHERYPSQRLFPRSSGSKTPTTPKSLVERVRDRSV